jgi:thiamine kinase-like enzyme
VFSVDDMRDPYLGSLVAQTLAAWHKVVPGGKQGPQLFPTLRKWINAIPSSYNDPKKRKLFDELGLCVEKLSAELTNLRVDIEALDSPVVSFCHNDLLSGNILYNEETSTSDLQRPNSIHRLRVRKHVVQVIRYCKPLLRIRGVRL